MKDCSFCDIVNRSTENQILCESEMSLSFEDKYPVSLGHSLLIPRIHEPNFFKLPTSNQFDLWKLLTELQEILTEKYQPDGFNIGVNVNSDAGQTVEHAHIHLIPRYKGDVADPRGGIRWVIPQNAPYWD